MLENMGSPSFHWRLSSQRSTGPRPATGYTRARGPETLALYQARMPEIADVDGVFFTPSYKKALPIKQVKQT